MTFLFLLPFVVAAGGALFFTPLVARVATRWGAVDQPGPRKIHTTPIPLLGGVGVYLAFVLAVAWCWQLGLVGVFGISSFQLLVVCLAGAVLVVGGSLDDRFRLAPLRQLMFPVAATAMVVASGVTIRVVTNPLGGVLAVPVAIGAIVTFAWLLGMSYTTKFLDGLDGLVTSITLVAALCIFAVSLRWDQPQAGTWVLALALAGACIGFLVYNWHPASIFLGEGGSVLCGFLLAVLAVISGSKIATVGIVMAVPIVDAGVVLLRRWRARSSLVVGDQRHFHFQLLDAGFSQRQAVALLVGFSVLAGLFSLVLGAFGKALSIAALLASTAVFLLAHSNKQAS